jgi:hypothetical protein
LLIPGFTCTEQKESFSAKLSTPLSFDLYSAKKDQQKLEGNLADFGSKSLDIVAESKLHNRVNEG